MWFWALSKLKIYLFWNCPKKFGRVQNKLDLSKVFWAMSKLKIYFTHIVAKGNFLIESESLTFDLLLLLRRWKESCSVNQFLWCKSIFCSPFWCQIWLQSFLGALLLLLLQSYMNPFLWAIWPYAEAFAATTTTVAIASFFSHWEKHSQCNAFFNLGNLTLCTTRLQNLDGFWKFLKEAKNQIK